MEIRVNLRCGWGRLALGHESCVSLKHGNLPGRYLGTYDVDTFRNRDLDSFRDGIIIRAKSSYKISD